MPPPRPRRPGHSRRAQYGLFFGYVAAIAGMVVAALLLVVSVFDPRGFAALQTAVTDMTAPVAGFGRGLRLGGENAVEAIGAYVDAGTRNRAMTAELAAARTRLIEAEAAAFENRRLRGLLGLAREAPGPVAAARLVSSTPGISRRFATIDAGARRGVRPGFPVRAAEGLIGRVDAVGAGSARVQLLTDPGSAVPVRRATDGIPAIAVGLGDGSVELRAPVAGENPFRIGDVIVTSGVGGVFAPGIPIGTVARLTAEGALLVPRADPARVDVALVYPLALVPMPAPAPLPDPDEGE